MRFLIVLILTLILSACSTIFSPGKTLQEGQIKKKVLKNLQVFRSFKLEGTIEITSKQFAFYKDIVIKKNKDKFRIDIFSGGLFGLSSKMDAQIFVSDSILIYLPKANLLLIDNDYILTLKDTTIKIPSHYIFPEILSQNAEWKIIKKDILVVDGDINYIFSPNTFHLKEIYSGVGIITFSDYRNGFPYKISIKKGKQFSVKLNIDRVDGGQEDYQIKMFEIGESAKKVRI